MVLYIDPPLWPAHGTHFSHLSSDESLAELHAFAAAAGVPERAFDGDHYDVPERRFDDLVAAGAVPVEGRILVRRLIASGLRIPARQRNKSLKVPVNVVFPTEHLRKIINAARAGKKVMEVVVYDGSDTGDKLFNTLTVIGHPIPPGEKVPSDVAGKAPALANLTRWPVTVSYFERNAKAEREGEETPAYSITFELYENGISRGLMLNYSDFSISGELTSLDIMKPKPCK